MGRFREVKKFAFSLVLLVFFAVAGCSSVEKVETVKPPTLDVTCPDPDARRLLTEGATFRDLAKSREEALWGWTLCHDALDVAQLNPSETQQK